MKKIKKVKESDIGGWGYSRGHKTICLSNTKIVDDWRFEDTLKPIYNARECAKCGIVIKHGEPDACLGMLPNVKYACCGHGIKGEGYVMFDNGERISIEEYYKRQVIK